MALSLLAITFSQHFGHLATTTFLTVNFLKFDDRRKIAYQYAYLRYSQE